MIYLCNLVVVGERNGGWWLEEKYEYGKSFFEMSAVYLKETEGITDHLPI